MCSGNTCRSPIAKVLAEAALSRAKMDDWLVDSAGLSAFVGQSASGDAYAVARDLGLDLSLHQSKPLSPESLAEADLVLVMTDNHKQAILAQVPHIAGKLHTLKEYVGENSDVADPYGGGPVEYRLAAQELEQLIVQLIEKMKE